MIKRNMAAISYKEYDKFRTPKDANTTVDKVCNIFIKNSTSNWCKQKVPEKYRVCCKIKKRSLK